MALKISEAQYEDLRRHGEETYPHECCGVLVGKEVAGLNTVLAVIRCRNTSTDSPRTRYEIDPLDLIPIQRDSHLSGRKIVGFYHSHPDHPVQWSTTDLAEAYWVECSYVITSIQKGKAVCTSSYRLLGDETNKHFEEEEIQVDAAEHSNDFSEGIEFSRDP